MSGSLEKESVKGGVAASTTATTTTRTTTTKALTTGVTGRRHAPNPSRDTVSSGFVPSAVHQVHLASGARPPKTRPLPSKPQASSPKTGDCSPAPPSLPPRNFTSPPSPVPACHSQLRHHPTFCLIPTAPRDVDELPARVSDPCSPSTAAPLLHDSSLTEDPEQVFSEEGPRRKGIVVPIMGDSRAVCGMLRGERLEMETREGTGDPAEIRPQYSAQVCTDEDGNPTESDTGHGAGMGQSDGGSSNGKNSQEGAHALSTTFTQPPENFFPARLMAWGDQDPAPSSPSGTDEKSSSSSLHDFGEPQDAISSVPVNGSDVAIEVACSSASSHREARSTLSRGVSERLPRSRSKSSRWDKPIRSNSAFSRDVSPSPSSLASGARLSLTRDRESPCEALRAFAKKTTDVKAAGDDHDDVIDDLKELKRAVLGPMDVPARQASRFSRILGPSDVPTRKASRIFPSHMTLLANVDQEALPYSIHHSRLPQPQSRQLERTSPTIPPLSPLSGDPFSKSPQDSILSSTDIPPLVPRQLPPSLVPSVPEKRDILPQVRRPSREDGIDHHGAGPSDMNGPTIVIRNVPTRLSSLRARPKSVSRPPSIRNHPPPKSEPGTHPHDLFRANAIPSSHSFNELRNDAPTAEHLCAHLPAYYSFESPAAASSTQQLCSRTTGPCYGFKPSRPSLSSHEPPRHAAASVRRNRTVTSTMYDKKVGYGGLSLSEVTVNERNGSGERKHASPFRRRAEIQSVVLHDDDTPFADETKEHEQEGQAGAAVRGVASNQAFLPQAVQHDSEEKAGSSKRLQMRSVVVPENDSVFADGTSVWNIKPTFRCGSSFEESALATGAAVTTEDSSEPTATEVLSHETAPASCLLNDEERRKATERRQKQMITRKHICHELWNTEQNYNHALSLLQEHFQKPLQQLVKTSAQIVSPVFIRIVFSFVKELQELSEGFANELHGVVEDWSDDVKLGDLFLKHEKDWQKFLKYVDNYSAGQSLVREAMEVSQLFRDFDQKAKSSRETARQGLNDFLILPIQRVARYALLLKDLRKHTPEDHPDYKDIEEAFSRMSDLAATVNQVKQREEETTRMFEVFKLVDGCPATIIKSQRRLILEMDVSEVKSGRPMRIFLYSDVLMMARQFKNRLGVSRQVKYKFLRLVDLLHLGVEEVTQAGTEKYLLKFSIDPLSESAKSSTITSTSAVNDSAGNKPADVEHVNLNLNLNITHHLFSHNGFPSNAITSHTKSSSDDKHLPLCYTLSFSDLQNKDDFFFAVRAKLHAVRQAQKANSVDSKMGDGRFFGTAAFTSKRCDAAFSSSPSSKKNPTNKSVSPSRKVRVSRTLEGLDVDMERAIKVRDSIVRYEGESAEEDENDDEMDVLSEEDGDPPVVHDAVQYDTLNPRVRRKRLSTFFGVNVTTNAGGLPLSKPPPPATPAAPASSAVNVLRQKAGLAT